MSDYIKRDDAIRLLRGRAAAKYPVSFYVGLFAAADEIGRMPDTDVAPVVRGRWVEHVDPLPWCEDDVDVFWECSACGTPNFALNPYCPQCGARMEAES